MSVVEGNLAKCPSCGTKTKLPENVVAEFIDFKHLELDGIDDAYRTLKPSSGELDKIVAGFIRNVDRVAFLGMFPDWLLNKAFVYVFDRAAPMAVELSTDRDPDWFEQFSVRWPNSASDVINRRPSKGSVLAIDGLYSFMLMGAWTAFESMATDLWVKAVDLRPKTLAHNVVMVPTTATKRGDRKDGAQSRQSDPKNQSKPQEPRILFSDLADHGFNISAMMGQFLRDQDRVRFDSLAGLKTAYYDAFRFPLDKEKRPSSKLTEFFDKVFPGLKCLEAIRNLLAHRGGIVDQPFRDEVQLHSATLHALPLDEPLSIDGEFVAGYVNKAIHASTFLLAFVSEWLDKYAE